MGVSEGIMIAWKAPMPHATHTDSTCGRFRIAWTWQAGVQHYEATRLADKHCFGCRMSKSEAKEACERDAVAVD